MSSGCNAAFDADVWLVSFETCLFQSCLLRMNSSSSSSAESRSTVSSWCVWCKGCKHCWHHHTHFLYTLSNVALLHDLWLIIRMVIFMPDCNNIGASEKEQILDEETHFHFLVCDGNADGSAASFASRLLRKSTCYFLWRKGGVCFLEWECALVVSVLQSRLYLDFLSIINSISDCCYQVRCSAEMKGLHTHINGLCLFFSCYYLSLAQVKMQSSVDKRI